MSRPSLQVVVVLCTLALLGGHVHARLKPDSELNFVDRGLLAVTGPVQKVLSSGLRGLAGGFQGYVALVGVQERNEELEAELALARAAVIELAEIQAASDRARVLAGLRTRLPGEALGAEVIGRGTSARFRTLRIDRGTDDGVAPGMAVLAAQGAVGRILRASGHYADVLLITDGLSAVGAVVQRSRARCVGVGDGDEGVELGYIRRADLVDVREGDVLVTSGEDGVFPPGVPLGLVSAAAPAESGLFIDASMEPAVPLDRVEEVLVVLDPGNATYSSNYAPALAGPFPEELRGDAWGPPMLDAGELP